jgi:hypothetical protein
MSTRQSVERRDFLGQIGKTLGAALGFALLPSVAKGAPGQRARHSAPDTLVHWTCCANASKCGGGCGSGKVKFRCTDGNCPAYCTTCQDVNPNCYSFDGPQC